MKNNYVCFHCNQEFRVEFFKEVFLCSRCSVLALEHRRNLTQTKPEVESYVRSGARVYGEPFEVEVETDNRKPKKFVTENLELPSKE